MLRRHMPVERSVKSISELHKKFIVRATSTQDRCRDCTSVHLFFRSLIETVELIVRS